MGDIAHMGILPVKKNIQVMDDIGEKCVGKKKVFSIFVACENLKT